MKPWQRNRFAFVAVLASTVITANIPGLTTGQILSLGALYLVLFLLYVKYFNRYQK